MLWILEIMSDHIENIPTNAIILISYMYQNHDGAILI